MDKKVIIMNFSGVYSEEPFALNPRFTHLDCTHLHGTDCYCDKDGQRAIRRIIAPYPAQGIHFIDSGDYHYVTKFWTDKISIPFSLVLFDHHTDMQPSQWGGMLSCGGWVKDMADTNPLLNHVIILGIPEASVASIPKAYHDKVKVVTDAQLHNHAVSSRSLAIAEPLYISIDKDVLDTNSARTDWDQGTLSLDEMKRILHLIMKHEQVIGIDVCGECPATLGLFSTDNGIIIDDNANRELLEMFRQQRLF